MLSTYKVALSALKLVVNRFVEVELAVMRLEIFPEPANRFVEEAVVEKKFVDVAFVRVTSRRVEPVIVPPVKLALVKGPLL